MSNLFETKHFDRTDGTGRSTLWMTERGDTLAYVDYTEDRQQAECTVFDPTTSRSRRYPMRSAAAAEGIVQRHLAKMAYQPHPERTAPDLVVLRAAQRKAHEERRAGEQEFVRQLRKDRTERKAAAEAAKTTKYAVEENITESTINLGALGMAPVLKRSGRPAELFDTREEANARRRELAVKARRARAALTYTVRMIRK